MPIPFRTAVGSTGASECSPRSKFCVVLRRSSTAARPSPSGWLIGPMKREPVLDAACSARLPSRERRASKQTGSASTRNGISLEEAVRRCGIEIERIAEAARERENASAYLELHIEQGPVLERMGFPLAAVLGTKGVERHAITFIGQEAHSGSTPMNVRRDALAAAAKLALEIRPIAARHKDAVCTVGSLKTFPGIVTAVVGRCEATLDQRDLDPAVLASMYREAVEASKRFAEEERCSVEWSRIWNIEPVPFHSELIQLCQESIRELAGDAPCLPSGPLHDAAEVSRAGIPTVMMFVQSLGGISHNKIEDTAEEHIALAVSAFDRLASKTAAWIQHG